MASIGDMPREWSTNFTIDDFICACASRGLTVGQACDEAAARGLGISKASARRIAEQFGTPFRSQVNNQDESALREAETRKRRDVNRREAELGKTHPHTLMSVGHLANTLSELGHLAEAEKCFRRVVEGRERAFGPTDADTLRSIYSLAENLRRQGRMGEAAAMYARERDGRRVAATARSQARLVSRRRTQSATTARDVALARQALSSSTNPLGGHPDEWNTDKEAEWDRQFLAAEAKAGKEAAVATHIASAAERRRAAEKAAKDYSETAIARARERADLRKGRVPDYQSMLESLGSLQAHSRNTATVR